MYLVDRDALEPHRELLPSERLEDHRVGLRRIRQLLADVEVHALQLRVRIRTALLLTKVGLRPALLLLLLQLHRLNGPELGGLGQDLLPHATRAAVAG